MSAAAKAEAARLEGNDAMRRKDFNTAFNCYTVALQSMPREHAVLANRSQAALKLRHYALALRDGCGSRVLFAYLSAGAAGAGAAGAGAAGAVPSVAHAHAA